MNETLRAALTPRVIFGAVAVAVVFLLLVFAWLNFSAPPAANPASLMADVTLVPAPTATFSAPGAALDPYAPTLTPTLAPGQISLGAYVQVVGTEGQGLRIRAAPGLGGEQQFMGFDSEVFVVQDGPQETDGYVWWYLVSNYDDGRAGWAVADFLEMIPAP